MDVDAEQLREAIESQHGGKATFVETVPVREEFRGQVVFDGVVGVFDLEGHPDANRAYAYSFLIDDKTDDRRFVAILGVGHIRSAKDAVRAAIMALHNAGKL